MKTLLIRLLIWLFEKYAFDYWVDKQTQESDKEGMEKFEVDTIEELREIQRDEQDESQREAYDAGLQAGYERATNNTGY